MRVAVIGAGIAGLTASLRLDAVHDVTLFEAADFPGGHAHTVDVDFSGEQHALDVAFMVFNDRTYPHFISMLKELGVASNATTMSFSVHDPQSGLEYNGSSVDAIFAQRRNLFRPGFYRMLGDILRFNREVRRMVHHRDSQMTVGEFLAESRYSRRFIEHYLLPMGAAIWSCPAGTFNQFPITFVAEFFHNHGLLDLIDRPTWRVVCRGARTYVNAVLARLRGRLRLRTPIASVRRRHDRIEVLPAEGASESFDHVIFACHSDQALRILGDDATKTEREVLSVFPYQCNTAVLHTDVRLLPRSRRAWACWNVRTCKEPNAAPITTYNLNLLQHIRSQHTFCLTLNADSEIDPRLVLRRFEFQHPVFNPRRYAAQARHRELIDVNRTSFCGAYWRNGFHEDGVVSALAVVATLRQRCDARATDAAEIASPPLAEIAT
jgi:predicted NAD/FAD-binding protein